MTDYVLRHNPDLLVIGGISNREDHEAVRSVIRQVRAKKPDTEVLLLTPVFGRMKDEHLLTFTPEIDPAANTFRRNMQKVAAEEKCAFFDMTGPLVDVHPAKRQDVRLVQGRCRPRQPARLARSSAGFWRFGFKE